MKLKLLLASFLTFVAMTAQGQNPVGDWKGTLDIPQANMKLELIFHIKGEGNNLKTTMDVPMQGAMDMPVDKTTFEGGRLTLNVAVIQFAYSGTLTGDKIVGNVEQMGFKLPLTLSRFSASLPGNTSLPSTEAELRALAALDKGTYKYKVEDYFAKPKASSFQLSPNGRYLSYKEKDDAGKQHVYVKELSTGTVRRAIEEKEELIQGYGWINDERLYYAMDRGGNENYHVYVANIDGTNSRDLTPFDGVRASIDRILKDQKDILIISMNKNNPQIFEPYRLNVVTGELTLLYENKDAANPIQGYEFDKDGELRGYSRLVNGVESELYYKDRSSGEFRLVRKMRWDDTFSPLSFNYASSNKDEAYVLTNLDSDKTRIVLYDFAKNQIVREVFAHDDYDVSSLHLSRKRNYELDYVAYEGEKSVLVPLSATFKDLHERMQKEFPGKEVAVVDYDDNETTFLIVVHSDRLIGTYYQYDAGTKKFSLLYDLMPQLHEEDMAEVRPITFRSRDGLTIHGYITLPKAALNGEKVPLIVNPHGGPQGIRDSWGFNPETQLFASRGYATLQVNFRISGGYGKEFLRAGFKQIGRKAMDDVEDGVRYAISQGWVDPERIAIYGASHGGYATLMGLVKTPELYACGVDYVGVSNIYTFFDSFPEYWKPFKELVKEIWYDLDNPEEAAIAKEVSPVFQIDKINKPLFVVQGANDPRVNINESDQIVTALRARGFEVPYMVKYNEGHGFHREENSMDLYRAMLGFFAKYLKH